jgi:hypothetical protein
LGCIYQHPSYRLFKNDYVKEEYLSVNMPGKYKCSFAKLRCGVAPLKIETGRYEGVINNNANLHILK